MSTETKPAIRIWIAAYTGPNAEVAVRDAVKALGYAALVPTAMTEMHHARQVMVIDRPVFPRYAFVGIPVGMSWYPVRGVKGIAGILSSNGEPRPVPKKAVDLLSAAVEADAFTKAVQPMFSEGQPVKISLGGGELEGFVGRITSTLPAQRIEVVFQALGKQQRTRVKVDQIKAA